MGNHTCQIPLFSALASANVRPTLLWEVEEELCRVSVHLVEQRWPKGPSLVVPAEKLTRNLQEGARQSHPLIARRPLVSPITLLAFSPMSPSFRRSFSS